MSWRFRIVTCVMPADGAARFSPDFDSVFFQETGRILEM